MIAASLIIVDINHENGVNFYTGCEICIEVFFFLNIH